MPTFTTIVTPHPVFSTGTVKISVGKQNSGRGVTKFGGPRNSGVRSPFEEHWWLIEQNSRQADRQVPLSRVASVGAGGEL